MEKSRKSEIDCGEVMEKQKSCGNVRRGTMTEDKGCGRQTVKIKICGLSREEDIDYVNEARPDYCGFIINFPKSRRNVTPDRVRELVRGLDETICPVGVFVDEPVETIMSLASDGTLGAVQLHGKESQEYVVELKRRLAEAASGRGRIPVIQAFKILTAGDAVCACRSAADYILLDSGTGTGQTFDWSLAGEMDRPFFLAGGLGPENLQEAIRRMRPYAVDMSSSVETDGVKDRSKIIAAVDAVRADAE